MDLTDPTTVALAASQAFEQIGNAAAVYGGLALAAFGEPRETKDADFVVASLPLDRLIRSLDSLGLSPEVSFERVGFGGNLITRVALLGGPTAAGLNVLDLVEPRYPQFAADVLSRAMVGTLRGQTVRLVSPEDFVLVKVLSTREIDLNDAASVLRCLRDRLDIDAIRRTAQALAREIPDHDVAERLDRVFEIVGSR